MTRIQSSHSIKLNILAPKFAHDVQTFQVEFRFRVTAQGHWKKAPNFRCVRVRSTHAHLKFGYFLWMAEQLRFRLRELALVQPIWTNLNRVASRPPKILWMRIMIPTGPIGR